MQFAKTLFTTVTLSTLALFGCSDDSSESGSRTFESQVADGMELYGDNCARCHDSDGSGTDMAPALVGTVGDDVLLRDPVDGAVRDVQFETALDVFEWVSENMPGDDPGTLETQEYVDILAFALFANGVELDEPLSGDNAGDIVINP